MSARTSTAAVRPAAAPGRPEWRRPWLLALGAAAALIVYGAWALDAERERGRLEARLPELRAAATTVDAHADEVARLRARIAPTSADDLAALVQRQAQAAGLARAAVQGDRATPDRVRLVADAAAFRDWLMLVQALREQRVALLQVRVERLPGGAVRIEAVLVRSAASR